MSQFKDVDLAEAILAAIVHDWCKINFYEEYYRNVKDDETIQKYERRYNTDEIPIIDGFKLSSNYVFRYLVKEHYAKKPDEYISRLYEYKLGDVV